MINFPEIDLKNEKVRVIFFVLGVMLFFFNQFQEKTLLSIIVIFIIINYYYVTRKTIQDKVITKKSPLLLNYNNKIERLLKNKKFKKRSPHNYKEGMYYWVQFMKNIDLLEDDDLYHYNDYFENAQNYLQKSVNLFQSLGTEAQERNYIDASNYNDFVNSKELMEHTHVVQELYKESMKYYIIYH